jgi:hypothetical protein
VGSCIIHVSNSSIRTGNWRGRDSCSPVSASWPRDHAQPAIPTPQGLVSPSLASSFLYTAHDQQIKQHSFLTTHGTIVVETYLDSCPAYLRKPCPSSHAKTRYSHPPHPHRPPNVLPVQIACVRYHDESDTVNVLH